MKRETTIHGNVAGITGLEIGLISGLLQGGGSGSGSGSGGASTPPSSPVGATGLPAFKLLQGLFSGNRNTPYGKWPGLNYEDTRNTVLANAWYLQENPDVAKAWNDTPFTHYIVHGQKEGRQWKNFANDVPYRPTPKDSFQTLVQQAQELLSGKPTASNAGALAGSLAGSFLSEPPMQTIAPTGNNNPTPEKKDNTLLIAPTGNNNPTPEKKDNTLLIVIIAVVALALVFMLKK